MASLRLWGIRLMRRLPISAAFSHHLSECAAVEIWSERRLSWSQIFCRAPLELDENAGDPHHAAIQAAVAARRPAHDRRRVIDRPPPTFDNNPKPIW